MKPRCTPRVSNDEARGGGASTFKCLWEAPGKAGVQPCATTGVSAEPVGADGASTGRHAVVIVLNVTNCLVVRLYN